MVRAVRRSSRMSVLLVLGCLSLVAAGCARNTGPAGDVAGLTAEAQTSVDTALADSAPATPLPTFAPLTRVLEMGHKGDDVLNLQRRLSELRFDVGLADGYFGLLSKQAVTAYQHRVVGLRGKDANGKVSPELFQRMLEPLGISDPRPAATLRHLVLDLPSQTAMLWEGGELKLFSVISSGSGEEWCELPNNVPAWRGATTTTLPAGVKPKKVCGQSITPGGMYTVYRHEEGWWDIPLGRVHNPLYFNSGIAVHGSENVPNKPVSHGCVRVPMHVSNYLYTIFGVGDQVFVFDGVKEPEEYGAQRPPPDFPDPEDTGATTTAKKNP